MSLDIQCHHDACIDSLFDKGYAILDDFLQESVYIALKAHAALLFTQNKFKTAHIGQGNAMTAIPSIRSDMILWLDKQSNVSSVAVYLHKMEQLKIALNQSLFLGLADFETHIASYPPGAFYKKHVDQFMYNQDRRISCVYYLNDDWQVDDGGQLALYGSNDEILEMILPTRNRLVCFRSDIPHEVYETYRQRLSITGWFKVRAAVL